ncbi:alpha/beta hydrolase [Actinophytocola algeriensis]|uniref:Pimeloyl-ACP methyl ester carboxylesterase n=1 Tax=Actinophytocola algeriensis TaxID=1768010 RepID=A0A7W7VGF6_9PSEU|nr:alpha/beta fold hydrolase [Actinophytocola algeriensis]MBB4909119.1 pimeloyl-ACP methyl ester carboxylesterase [Actinophytocola algeriensis]MBE1474493.1 pimeloyl-ACP methyl ester carboxylesterase [Actinophytocola algeriensis]
MTEPRLRKLGATGADVRAAVLVLHGGQENSTAPSAPWHPAYVRMIPFARDLRRAPGVAVWQLCNRYRGWNAPDLDPVADARWALERLHQAHPDIPVALVGHSMGGRVALRVADDRAVAGVCALAPWTPAGEPVGQLADRTVLIAHGDRDRMTDPALSYTYAERAKEVTDAVARFDVLGEGHALLRRYREWTSLVRRFTLGVLGVVDLDREITEALAKPAPAGLRVPV